MPFNAVKLFGLILLGSIVCPFAASADVLLIERAQATHDIDLPKRGEMMRSVESRFGAPSQRHAPVGGSSPVHPPITRWDYPNFSVYFENDHVVSAVLRQSSPQETGVKPAGR